MITATPQPSFHPPRVRIDVETGSGFVMKSVSVSRISSTA